MHILMNLITICIPTYNQSKKLDILLNQISKYIPNIPIILSDNCSTDDTQIVIKKYKNKLKNFVYSTNNKNLGFDKNYLITIKNVKTQYFWLLGSDDEIYPKSVSRILKILKVLNYPDGITFRDHAIKELDKNKKYDKFQVLRDSNYIGIISLNIIKKKTFPGRKIYDYNFSYIQNYYCLKKIISEDNWYIHKYIPIVKFNFSSLDEKIESGKYLTRLNQDINGYIYFILKLLKKKKLMRKLIKNLYLKKI